MGRITDIEKVINSTVNAYSHVKIIPRGLPRFVDTLLRGTIRFAKRTGNSISVINPDNTFAFGETPQIQDTKVVLENETGWLTPGAIVSLGPGKELHEIDDIVDETVFLKDTITRDFTDQDKLLLHSYPMINSLDAPAGSTVITVKSHYPLANGDVFAYLATEGLLQSLTEIKILKATRLGTTTDLFYSRLYNIELETGVGRDLASNSFVYQRAYPAYFSTAVRVPESLFTSEPIGPFLLDVLSGRLVEGTEFGETLAVKTLSRTGSYILGDSTSYVTIDKNHNILDRSLPAHTPMFWEIAEGTMKLTPNRIVFQVSSKNQFVVGYKCTPPLPADVERSWKISVLPSEDCSIRFIFHPHAEQEFALTSGVSQTVTVTIPPGEDVTSIEINILASADICNVRLSDWTPVHATVEQIEYSFVAEAAGAATYQATGLIVKPYFIGPEFLKATYDTSGDSYNGGKVYF